MSGNKPSPRSGRQPFVVAAPARFAGSIGLLAALILGRKPQDRPRGNKPSPRSGRQPFVVAAIARFAGSIVIGGFDPGGKPQVHVGKQTKPAERATALCRRGYRPL